MNDRILHTPEGVRDLYGEELARKKHIERALHKRLAGFFRISAHSDADI